MNGLLARFYPKPAQTEPTAPVTGDVVEDTHLIVVDMYHPDRNPWREGFTGRWLTSSYVDAAFDKTRMVWRIAITRTGALVAYRHLDPKDRDGHEIAKDHLDTWAKSLKTESLLLRFDTFDDLAATVSDLGYPVGVLDSARASHDHAIVHSHRDW